MLSEFTLPSCSPAHTNASSLPTIPFSRQSSNPYSVVEILMRDGGTDVKNAILSSRSFCFWGLIWWFFNFLMSCDKKPPTVSVGNSHLNPLQTQGSITLNKISVKKLEHWDKKECWVLLVSELIITKTPSKKKQNPRRTQAWVSGASSPPLLKAGQTR